MGVKVKDLIEALELVHDQEMEVAIDGFKSFAFIIDSDLDGKNKVLNIVKSCTPKVKVD